MQNIVGQIATKENFLPRVKELKRIIRNLQAGASVQIAAPRRVGKTSILHYFLNNPLEGFVFVYIDVESARTKQDFYRKLYREILRNPELNDRKGILKQLTEKATQALKRLKKVDIGGLGEIILGNDGDIDYEEELLNLLEGINLGGDRLVIMIDEFPEVLLNMVQDDKGDTKQARQFLQSNREFRHKQELQGKIQFIYTGSNSLNLTVSGIDSTELISDLPAMAVDLLDDDQSSTLIRKVLATYGHQIPADCVTYMIQQVEWSIPFYYQLTLQELLDLLDEGEEVTCEKIEEAIAQISHPRNDNYFRHYLKRLDRVFGSERMKFIVTLLNTVGQHGEISFAEALNTANGLLDSEQVKYILDSLCIDGYISQVKEKHNSYKFNSPILKNWWNRQKHS